MDKSTADLIKLLINNISLKGGGEKDYNSQDAKFVRKMIKHHEMAVEMAGDQVSKGENKEIIDLAKEIKGAQKQEIDQMRTWLKARDLSEDGDGGM